MRPAQVFGLGFVSVFDQVLEGLPDGDKGSLFEAYLSSLDEDPKQFREARSSLQFCTCCASTLHGPCCMHDVLARPSAAVTWLRLSPCQVPVGLA